MIPFDKMAQFYDTMYTRNFSTRMVDYTLQILKKSSFEPDTVLDLCCGTGTALQQFSEKGCRVDGLDRSRGMLTVARKKLRGRKVFLYRQALPRFQIVQSQKAGRKVLRQYDLITSYFDSLNFLLTERDLKAAFRSVFHHLRPGGWFVFDMNTVAMFKPLWNEHPWVGVRDDMIWIMRSQFLKAKSMTRLNGTYFAKQGRHWQRHDEEMYERAYPNQKIKAMLRSAGFQNKGYYHCLSFNPVTRDTKKFCAAARKPDR
jgi:ubiquinone/menaquinone biosynthesis C-methylase UbiE